MKLKVTVQKYTIDMANGIVFDGYWHCQITGFFISAVSGLAEYHVSKTKILIEKF